MRGQIYKVRNGSQFAIALRALRESRKLTQGQVGIKAQVPQTMVSKIEGGLVNPTLATCFRLLQALDLEVVVYPRSKTNREASFRGKSAKPKLTRKRPRHG